MTDEFRPHGGFGIDFRLEREDAQHAADAGGDFRNPSCFPGPHLRADVIDDGNTDLVEPLCETDVEAWIVDHDDNIRLFLCGAVRQIFHQIEKEADMTKNFYDANDTEIRGINHDVHAGGSHFVGTHAADGDVRAAFGDGTSQPGPVVVA